MLQQWPAILQQPRNIAHAAHSGVSDNRASEEPKQVLKLISPSGNCPPHRVFHGMPCSFAPCLWPCSRVRSGRNSIECVAQRVDWKVDPCVVCNGDAPTTDGVVGSPTQGGSLKHTIVDVDKLFMPPVHQYASITPKDNQPGLVGQSKPPIPTQVRRFTCDPR